MTTGKSIAIRNLKSTTLQVRLYERRLFLTHHYKMVFQSTWTRMIVYHPRSRRLHIRLLKQFWADVVNTVAQLINYELLVLVDGRLLEETWNEKKVNLSHIRVFSYISYVYIDAEHINKLDLKSRKHTFIGYSSNDFGYQFWDE